MIGHFTLTWYIGAPVSHRHPRDARHLLAADLHDRSARVAARVGQIRLGAGMGRCVSIALLRLPAYTEFLFGFAVLVGSIGALLFLNRKSELAVMRAGGMSVWQFLWPGMLVAFLVGLCRHAGVQSAGRGGRGRMPKSASPRPLAATPIC